MRSLATIGYKMKKPYQIANLITTTPTARTTTRTTLVALGDPSPGLKVVQKPNTSKGLGV